MAWPGVLRKYRDRVAIDGLDDPVTLLEGGTPLIPAPKIAELLGGGFELFLKYEGLNPTASFKDRGMTAAITHAKAHGAQAVICASTGNTAASAAAYAARAGMACFVLVPDGKIALGKLAGALAYGAEVVAIRGSFDDGLRMVREASARAPVELVNSVNPARIQGQKTASFEIVEALGDAPEWLVLPVGNAGNITSYWLGFREAHASGDATRLPQVLGAQAEGSAPIVHGRVVENPETVATAIRIGNPARWEEAKTALRESNGLILAVSDAEILGAYRKLATLEGVFCEPSSATGIAGLAHALCFGKVDVRGKRVVAILTGHGLKDPDSAVSGAKPPVTIDATMDDLMKVLES